MTIVHECENCVVVCWHRMVSNMYECNCLGSGIYSNDVCVCVDVGGMLAHVFFVFICLASGVYE